MDIDAAKLEQWCVRKRSGEVWGYIRKLIVAPATSQVVSADVLIAQSCELMRVPWANFETTSSGYILAAPDTALETMTVSMSK